MKYRFLLLASSFCGILSASAQSLAVEPSPEIRQIPGGEKQVYWFGHQGQSYFLQSSIQLENWFWTPLLEVGADEEIIHPIDNYLIPTSAFFRVVHTQQVPGEGETIETADFDSDGLSNIDEISPPPGSQTDPLNFDTDGDSLSDGFERTRGLDPNDNGSMNPDNGALGDPDRDGLTNREEQKLGLNPNASDSDGDGQSDADEDSDADLIPNKLDAVANDSEINWQKTPESRYVWVEQVEDIAEFGSPVAVNKHGQILFTKGLWNSASRAWVNLPPTNSLGITIYGESYTINCPPSVYKALNDDGTVLGYGYMESLLTAYGMDTFLDAGMIWRRTDETYSAYGLPTYFLPNYSTPDALESLNTYYWNSSSLANDGTVIGSYEALDNPDGGWKTYDSNAGGHGMIPMEGAEGLPGQHSVRCAVLDKNRSLLLEHRISTTENDRLWLVEGAWRSEISSDLSYRWNLSIDLVPSLKDAGGDRLWFTDSGTVRMEKRAGGTGVARWHNPPSMAEVAIRLNARGEAITSTKIWRNGEYTDLNAITGKSDTVAITKAIDLASNGIILAEATESGAMKTGLLLPVEVVELSPKVKDEDGNEIAGSENSNIGKPLTPFVEIDPHANRIAHRELKVKVGEPLKGKKVTWTLEALPEATPASIRGEWTDSPTHKDRFEASTAYGANEFRRVSQTTGETTIADDGNTAIRVNVPPIGFNQVRIKIQIEEVDTLIHLIDMEVPGVVVIDPGHGGNDSGAVGRTDSNILEKDLALAYGLKLQQELIEKFKYEKRGLRVKMTRENDSFIELLDRAPNAKDEGADVLVSIHFNYSDPRSDGTYPRGTETWYERASTNENLNEDITLATALNSSTFGIMQASDEGAINRGGKDGGLAVTRDGTSYNGNVEGYAPVKACLIEVEFLSNETALNSVKFSGETGEAIKNAFAEGATTDIFDNIKDQL